MYEKEKEELVFLCKKLYERQLVTACDGNVSSKVSEKHLLLTPSGKNKGFLKPEEIIVLDFDGNVVEGNGKPSKEFPMHQAIYRERPETGGVVHTHPVYATAFALAGKNIPDNLLIESGVMLQGCGLAEYAKPGSVELAQKIVPLLPDCDAILLKNHGAITYGKDLMDAFNKMDVLESIAKTIVVSRIIGEPQVIPGS